jgi:ATP-dependent RNA helicase DDX51/DBP6
MFNVRRFGEPEIIQQQPKAAIVKEPAVEAVASEDEEEVAAAIADFDVDDTLDDDEGIFASSGESVDDDAVSETAEVAESDDDDNVATDTDDQQVEQEQLEQEEAEAEDVEDDSGDDDDDVVAVSRPMKDVAAEWGLDARLKAHLQQQGVSHFFPIQISVVPDIVATERHSHVQSRDICVGAPTGSGKTLVYVLGVVQALLRRRVTRLRALVLLPSRDLAVQVHGVFSTYCAGTGLKVGLAIGQTNLLDEQLALVGAAAMSHSPVAAARALVGKAGSLRGGTAADAIAAVAAPLPAGGCSEIDILVATPGRLLDHLEQTPGFTLQHLNYLVIDEADRLLNQSYQDWVAKVLEAAYKQQRGDVAVHVGIAASSSSSSSSSSSGSSSSAQLAVTLQPTTVRGRPAAAEGRVRGAIAATQPMRKLLFSATLTNNPQKLASLGLANPIFYTAREGQSAAANSSNKRKRAAEEMSGATSVPRQLTDRFTLEAREGAASADTSSGYSLPASLTELTLSCDAAAKPLLMLALLLRGPAAGLLTVVFTSSVDSTHRLFRLLQLFGVGDSSNTDKEQQQQQQPATAAAVAEFSSGLTQKQRGALVRRAAAGQLRVIVCSDGMARGMDIAGVACVVNYDAPSHPRTYVHRVGRTARAGKPGTAITLLKQGQEGQFLGMRRKVDSSTSAQPLRSRPEYSDLIPRYRRCLGQLEGLLAAEKSGELNSAAAVDALSSDSDSDSDADAVAADDDADSSNAGGSGDDASDNE